MSYAEFIAGKHPRVARCGLDSVDESRFPAAIHPFQTACVRWALRRGRAALFCGTGLGKSIMQLAWSSYLATETGKPALILAPLAVTHQTAREGAKFGVPVTVCREASDVRPGVNVANYERLHKLDVSRFGCVVLDESSLLRAFDGKVSRALIDAFTDTRFRLCCTATPAPNDHEELGMHAEFLGAMPRVEMLTRWFTHDSGQTAVWRLKGYAAADFWAWVSSWAVCMDHPRDAGYDTAGYDLPPLEVQDHVVDPPDRESGDGMLFHMPDMSATGMHMELRATTEVRAAEVARLVALEPNEPWVVWCHTNYESDALQAAIPEAVDIRGDHSSDEKEARIMAFLDGRTRVVISKGDILGFGLNLQHCARTAFVGGSYSYERYYQSVRRFWRYGQTRPVVVHRVMASTEHALGAAVARKEEGHREMKRAMLAAVNTTATLREDLRLTEHVETREFRGDGWELWQGDSCERIREIPDASVDFTIYSPPFGSLYVYSDAAADMGNCDSWDEFFRHYAHLAPELLRITKPGRLCAVHCMQIPQFKWKVGRTKLYDFRGALIRAHEAAGWDYHSEVCIWKDPVTEMQRTKSIGLLHKQVCKDSTQSRQGIPDYLLIFRRHAGDDDTPEPVTSGDPKARFDRYVGSDGPDPAQAIGESGMSILVWQRYASPVWFDIDQTDVLNVRQARAEQDEKHLCPLALPVIQRAVHLWTNPGDLCFSPFGGIGSEGVGAIREGRRFLGIELKPGYVDVAVKNLRAAVAAQALPLLDGIA